MGLVGSFADCVSEDGEEVDEEEGDLTGADEKDDEREGGATVVVFVAGEDSSGVSKEELVGGE